MTRTLPSEGSALSPLDREPEEPARYPVNVRPAIRNSASRSAPRVVAARSRTSTLPNNTGVSGLFWGIVSVAADCAQALVIEFEIVLPIVGVGFSSVLARNDGDEKVISDSLFAVRLGPVRYSNVFRHRASPSFWFEQRYDTRKLWVHKRRPAGSIRQTSGNRLARSSCAAICVSAHRQQAASASQHLRGCVISPIAAALRAPPGATDVGVIALPKMLAVTPPSIIDRHRPANDFDNVVQYLPRRAVDRHPVQMIQLIEEPVHDVVPEVGVAHRVRHRRDQIGNRDDRKVDPLPRFPVFHHAEAIAA